MYVTRGFVIGCTLALLLGGLLAAGQSTFAQRYDDSPLTVPVSRIGDQVTYISFDKDKPVVAATPDSSLIPGNYGSNPVTISTSAKSPPKPSPNSDGWSEPHYVGSAIQELTHSIDRTDLNHDVLLVVSNRTGPGGATVSEYVDLTTREKLRADYRTLAGTTQVAFSALPSQLRGFSYQGHTFVLGEDVSALYPLPDWVSKVRDDIDVDSHVESRFLVGGYDTYAIRTELSVVKDVHIPAGSPSPTPVPGVDEPLRIQVTELSYVSSRVPYPVLFHRFVTAVRGSVAIQYQEMDTLADYTPGSILVQWGQDIGTEHYRASNPLLERTREIQSYPEDGTGRRLAYPLSQAVSDVLNDVTLTQFTTWRTDNSGYQLVGAILGPGSGDPTQPRWTLVFAVPTGSAHQVITQRNAGSQLPVTQDSAQNTVVPAYSAGDIPANPMTIAAAQLVWSHVVSPEIGTNAPNAIHWGLYTGATSRLANLKLLDIGYLTPGTAAGLPNQAPRTIRQSHLYLETDTGNIRSYSETRTQFDCVCHVQILDLEKPSPVAKTVRGTAMPPTVTQTTVATTSILGLFLAIYFLPVLKFLGGQALLLLPGYAKLRREEILDNKLRDQMLALIRAEPGIHASDLARRVDAGWGTIVYHLAVLEKNQMVSSLVDGRHKRFFPIGVVDFSRRGQVAILRNETTKSIFHMIAEDPGIIQGEIATKVGVTVPAAIWHLKRLEDAGLVGRAKQGRKVHYYANEGDPIAPMPNARDDHDRVELV